MPMYQMPAPRSHALRGLAADVQARADRQELQTTLARAIVNIARARREMRDPAGPDVHSQIEILGESLQQLRTVQRILLEVQS